MKKTPRIIIKTQNDISSSCISQNNTLSQSDGCMIQKRKQLSDIIENGSLKKLKYDLKDMDDDKGLDLGGYYLIISPKSEIIPRDLNLFYSIIMNEYEQVCQETPYRTNKMNFDEKFVKFPSSCAFENYKKNRYNDILCNEKTRFIFQNEESKDKDEKKYINANYIKGTHESNAPFIATQAPLEETLPEFYEMIWQAKSKIVISLSSINEGGRTKMFQFWPEKNQKLIISNFSLTIEEEVQVNNGILYRKILLQHLCRKEKRRIFQIHYTDWPDNGVPSDPSFLIEIYKLQKIFEQEGKLDNLDGPPVIHCSAGIGRTATYISFAFGSQIIEFYRKTSDSFDKSFLNSVVDVPLIVNHVRKQRSGSIQAYTQYGFVYKSLNYYLKIVCSS